VNRLYLIAAAANLVGAIARPHLISAAKRTRKRLAEWLDEDMTPIAPRRGSGVPTVARWPSRSPYPPMPRVPPGNNAGSSVASKRRMLPPPPLPSNAPRNWEKRK